RAASGSAAWGCRGCRQQGSARPTLGRGISGSRWVSECRQECRCAVAHPRAKDVEVEVLDGTLLSVVHVVWIYVLSKSLDDLLAVVDGEGRVSALAEADDARVELRSR